MGLQRRVVERVLASYYFDIAAGTVPVLELGMAGSGSMMRTSQWIGIGV
jgi:hypothetical protein